MSQSKTADLKEEATALLDKAVSAAVDAGLSHSEIDSHIRQFIISQNENKPKQRVLYTCSWGGFSFADDAEAFLAAKCPEFTSWDDDRENADVIAAIADFGKEACIRMPFILEDARVYKHFNLGLLFSPCNGDATSHDVDLVEAKETFSELYPRDPWHSPHTEGNFEEYAKIHPATWMFHRGFEHCSEKQNAFAFAHYLRENNHKKYLVPDNITPVVDNRFFEDIGLACVADGSSELRIAEVPAGIKYWISEYDGAEDVEY